MKDSRKEFIMYFLAGLIPVIWVSLLMAPYLKEGLINIILNANELFLNPFKITFCEDSIRMCVIGILAYTLGIGIYISNRKNYRRGEEHGSAEWGSVKLLGDKYKQSPDSNNKILTQNVSIGFNGQKHMRNLHVLVIGGSGAGKTRFFVIPNVLQSESSMVILDPKGEILRSTGNILRSNGYDVRVLDLIDMDKSHCYNPFEYIRNDNDVQKLVTSIFKSTTPPGSQSQDPFWDTAAQMLLSALIFYLVYEAPKEEQNFAMVMDMLRAGDVSEDDENYCSPLDSLFYELEEDDPFHIAVKYYKNYHSGSGKTLKSIQITLIARLEKFNLESVSKLTSTDELDLRSMGEKKAALFALIPDNDTSFNFIVSLLYTQIFQQLFDVAEHKYGGTLPVHVQFLMDEFANVSLPNDFHKLLAVMRGRGISVSIILQNLSQLKSLYEKDWENIVGNCDEFLYLGGNEQSTHKFVSEKLGKATIDTNTYGKSYGRNGNYSTNYQISGRELMTPDEVGMLDNKEAILFIRGEKPIKDFKYDIKKHPNYHLIPEAGGLPYCHGVTDKEDFVISLDYDPDVKEMKIPDELLDKYTLLSNEELEKEFEKMEDKE